MLNSFCNVGRISYAIALMTSFKMESRQHVLPGFNALIHLRTSLLVME